MKILLISDTHSQQWKMNTLDRPEADIIIHSGDFSMKGHISEVIAFFNNPINFDWGETTWEVTESEYILRFYSKQDKEIGKIWLCLEGCGMTKSIPFSPNMKYGGLSEIGKEGIEKIINKIQTE